MFHKRFNIEVGVDEARIRFINRIESSVFDRIPSAAHSNNVRDMSTLYDQIRYILGIRAQEIRTLRTYVGNDFLRCLQVLEALYEALEGTRYEEELSDLIDAAIRRSEVDLGVDWQPPVFVRTGARLLDESLVNEPLHWLSEPKYNTVYDPFEKGLSHYLEAEKKPHVLADVVTDMYEAVEALARIVTGKNKDLSGNQQSFIKAISASDYYKGLLKDYISYANQYRHAVRLGQPRLTLSEPEVESFIYLTGLFIRLAIRQTQPST